jgi:hypothetical protein
MPAFLERLIEKVRQGKWDEVEPINKKFDENEKKFGFPPKRRYRAYFGHEDSDTLIIEREWKSVAQYEEGLTKAWADAEEQKLIKEQEKIIESMRVEMYIVWPPKF